MLLQGIEGRQAMEKGQKEQEWLQKTQAELEAETEEMLQVSTRLNDNFVKALKMMWRQLFVIWAVVIILFIGSFFILRELLFVPSVAGVKSNPVKLSAPSGEVAVAPQRPVIQPEAAAPAWEKVQGILQQVREAQLHKDINLFMAAYSPSFPDLAAKKARILKTWERYNYLDLNFTVENFSSQKPGSIMAKVAWALTLKDRRSQEKMNLVKKYTVYFVNESGKWLIQNLVPEKTPRLAGKWEK
jgi:hypothetical protein